MRERRVWMIMIMLLIWAALFLVAANAVRCHAQNPLAQFAAHNDARATVERDAKDEVGATRASVSSDLHKGRLIVIGFVGGFVNRDDSSHPEVQFAAELRRRYPSSVYAEVFGNHHREAAHRQVLEWLDTDGDGILTTDEKQRARIIIYGHSWGASETVALARELGHRKIPVLLTIQVDSIAKPGEHDGLLPPNVANAVNFYQANGLFHGRSEIAAADPARTRIIGNFRMSYNDHPITSGSSSWFARMFMKSHIEIEDDPRIWEQAAVLIDSKLSHSASARQAQVSGRPAGTPP
jgi:hypothetical protein